MNEEAGKHLADGIDTAPGEVRRGAGRDVLLLLGLVH
jgi:hypothetical protein